MKEEATLRIALPALLATQLMAAEVYARFVGMSHNDERDLWSRMLAYEIEHVNYVNSLMTGSFTNDMRLPFANADRLNEVCERVTLQGMDSFILRLEGALRLECAELDYGLEALSAKRLARQNYLISYPGEIQAHLHELIRQARRYEASPNIAIQIVRLEDLYDSSIKGTTTIRRTISDSLQ